MSEMRDREIREAFLAIIDTLRMHNAFFAKTSITRPGKPVALYTDSSVVMLEDVERPLVDLQCRLRGNSLWPGKPE